MRSKLVIGGLTAAVALLLATNPVVVDAAGQITGADIKNGTVTGKDIKNNSVASKDIKNNSVKTGDVKDHSLTSDDLAAGTLPTVPKVRWALVNATHTAILAQSGGISIASTSGAGTYLNFGSSVAGSAVSATNAYLDADSSGTKGGIIITICGGLPYGGVCTVAGTNNTNHVWVWTEGQANTGENHAFYVSVIG